jgi:hypothetical protein
MKKIILIIIGIIVIGLVYYAGVRSNSVSLTKTTPTTTNSSSLCTRTSPYDNPPEFDRALSLITQRFQQTNTPLGIESAKEIESIKNCLDIQYASSDNEMNGAEGLFSFSSKSTKDRLKILVSPRYEIKDDILTAILVSHEIKHAWLFATDRFKILTCYDNEVNAFKFELAFIVSLNKEESSSLIYRYSNTNSSEVEGVINLTMYVGRSSSVGPYSDSIDNKILNYIKSIPAYQKECNP